MYVVKILNVFKKCALFVSLSYLVSCNLTNWEKMTKRILLVWEATLGLLKTKRKISIKTKFGVSSNLFDSYYEI